MLRKEDFEYIGTVGKTHGIHGEIALRLSVDIGDLVEAGQRIFLMLEEDGLLVPYAIASHRSKAGDIDLVRFDGVSTREEAERLTGMRVWLSRDFIGEDEEEGDPYAWGRYVGYSIAAQSGEAIGTVIEVDESTINTLLVVQMPERGEVLLPIAEELLLGSDDAARSLRLQIPEGLLDDSAEYDIH